MTRRPDDSAVPDGGDRRNFVIITTDDQGRWAMPHRMPELVMPHMEVLLAESLELDQMYCASPVCSPARASMLTGRMPSAHGVHDWLVGGRHPAAHPDHYLEGQPTTPEVLHDGGYQCAMAGKWHVGDSREAAPGFEHWYAHRYGGGPYYGAPIWNKGGEAVEPRYFTDAVTDSALDFLTTRDTSRPFYLAVNFTAPHDPWIDNHPDELVELYAETDFPSVPRTEPHPWVTPRREAFAAAFDDPHPHLAGYCASLTAVDSSLGRLRAALDEQGIAHNTVIIYISDNGFSCGHHGIWGKGNGTYPLNFWDNSVRVPCVVHLPGGATGTSQALLSSVSLHRSVCELAGVDVPTDRWGAGHSFVSTLRGDPAGGQEYVVVTSEYGGARMITDSQHKLVQRFDGPGELYDLTQDPDEQMNLYDDPAVSTIQKTLAESMQTRFQGFTRAGSSGWEQPVRGWGQVHPVSRGVPAEKTYVQTVLDSSDGEPEAPRSLEQRSLLHEYHQAFSTYAKEVRAAGGEVTDVEVRPPFGQYTWAVTALSGTAGELIEEAHERFSETEHRFIDIQRDLLTDVAWQEAHFAERIAPVLRHFGVEVPLPVRLHSAEWDRLNALYLKLVDGDEPFIDEHSQ